MLGLRIMTVICCNVKDMSKVGPAHKLINIQIKQKRPEWVVKRLVDLGDRAGIYIKHLKLNK